MDVRGFGNLSLGSSSESSSERQLPQHIPTSKEVLDTLVAISQKETWKDPNFYERADCERLKMEQVSGKIIPLVEFLQQSPLEDAETHASNLINQLYHHSAVSIPIRNPPKVEASLAVKQVAGACNTLMEYITFVQNSRRAKRNGHNLKGWSDIVKDVAKSCGSAEALEAYKSHYKQDLTVKENFEKDIDQCYQLFLKSREDSAVFNLRDTEYLYEFMDRTSNVAISQQHQIKKKLVRDISQMRLGKFFRDKMNREKSWPPRCGETSTAIDANMNKFYRIAEDFKNAPSYHLWDLFQKQVYQVIHPNQDDSTLGRYYTFTNPNSDFWRSNFSDMIKAEKEIRQKQEELTKSKSHSTKKTFEQKSKPTSVKESDIAGSSRNASFDWAMPESEPALNAEHPLERKLAKALQERQAGRRFEGEVARKMLDEIPWMELLDMNVIIKDGARQIAEYDIKTHSAWVELTLRCEGKTKQIMDRLLNEKNINPSLTPIILFAPNYESNAEYDIRTNITAAKRRTKNVAAFYLARDFDSLNDIFYCLMYK